MKIHKAVLIGVCAAASLAGVAAPIAANAEVNVFFRAPPPPVRVEVTPAPRHGYIWAPGYWDMRHDRHVWKKGHWERERHGYHYSQPSWVQRENRWELQRGGWRKGDRDGDGVPNRLDRDRDGDGVSNRHDDAPDNPRRH